MKNMLLFLLLAAAGLFLYLAFAAGGPEARQSRSSGRKPQDVISGVVDSQRNVGNNTSKALEGLEVER
ncbi:MAG: hypothetical protein R6V05_01780 [Candidatus Brocadiia bacterium]